MDLNTCINLLKKYINFDKLINPICCELQLSKCLNIKKQNFHVYCDEKINHNEKNKIKKLLNMINFRKFECNYKEYVYFHDEFIRIELKFATKNNSHLFFMET